MKASNIFWGTLILTVGTLFLLYNFDMFSLSPGKIFYLWPILLIIWGLSFFKLPKIIKYLMSFISGGFLGILLVSLLNINLGISNFEMKINNIFGDKSIGFSDIQLDSTNMNKYEIEYSPDFQTAELKFNAGAGHFYFKELSDKLLEIETNINGQLKSHLIDSSKMDIRFKTVNSDDIKIEPSGKVRFKMHPNPEWNFYLNIGAPKLDMDLSAFKVRNLLLDGGAADISIKLGNFHEETFVDMKLGISNILIQVPKSSGIMIESSSGISSNNMDEFNEISSNKYSTDNWDVADKKINIKIKSGISKIKVMRYE